MTRYENGNRNPSDDRLKEITKILLVDINLIKNYDFKNKTDIIYFLLWLEEFLSKVKN